MMKKLYKFVSDIINDSERELSERVFLIYSILSEIACFIALVGDIIMGEYIGEIITLIAVLLINPTVTLICVNKNRIKLAIKIIVVTFVFGILPALFFYGGGIYGGGFIWIIFGFMYVGLMLSGRWRKVILTFLILVSFTCYLVAYCYPELVNEHTIEMQFVDTAISIILVGGLCLIMSWYQNKLFKEENDRAKKEAERAEELTRSQNRFFSSMSHEIRTPINSILGLNELILRDQNTSEKIVQDAVGIQGAGKLLLALINDILDFSKMEAGGMEIVCVDYRIADVISEIVNMIWLKANEKGLKFDVSIDPKVPTVLYGDEVRLKQVIINLLNNAVKYTVEGEINLNIDSEDVDEKTTLLTISVSDTGMGIKKEAIPYLFDAFKRVDEERNRHIEGTGLGLSIVKQLVSLMDGNVTVNSVYGEGSTFTVTLKQGISDHTQIGDLNIHSDQLAKRDHYESRFKAPEAKVLIVDDNEMNLEVETKLLSETEVEIDTAISGKEALEKTVKNRYDVILMDHLMPLMDGVECFERVRNQTGGMNRQTPVVVLTANAGSENRELYNRVGFDGYLVKPVSGEYLESMLMKHISRDKLIITGKMMRMFEEINTSAGYARKEPVIITSTSVSDIPDDIVKKLNLPILPFRIQTDEGVFKDGIQMDANELIRYMNNGKYATSAPPDTKAYTDFFGSALKRAHHLIHISVTTSLSEDYKTACDAARSFDNVTVINSECISSAAGILVLIAYRLAQQGVPAPDIVEELEIVKKRLKCSFIIDTTEYMAKKGLISKRVNNVARALSVHPTLHFKNDRAHIGNVWVGSRKMAYRNYISKAFPVDVIPDSDVVFITYADVPVDTLLWIKEEISKIAYFERVVFKQTSAAITSNCGPGAIGIFYFIKSNKSYNLAAFIKDEEEDEEEDLYEDYIEYDVKDSLNLTELSSVPEQKWYEGMDFIDVDAAIKNSGSEDAFKTVLKIFYDSLDKKYDELQGFYEAQDWSNYTIKVHALKSSTKLVGAMELSDKALCLENAGKEANVDYITEEHDCFMEELKELGKQLEKYIPLTQKKEEDEIPKTKADPTYIEHCYESLRKAADAMDCDAIEAVLDELKVFILPEEDEKKIEEIRQKSDNFDYEGVLEVIERP